MEETKISQTYKLKDKYCNIDGCNNIVDRDKHPEFCENHFCKYLYGNEYCHKYRQSELISTCVSHTCKYSGCHNPIQAFHRNIWDISEYCDSHHSLVNPKMTYTLEARIFDASIVVASIGLLGFVVSHMTF
jgi:hypothetical protein